MKVKRKIIEINEDLCDGCGVCVPACAEGAIQIIEGKARLVAEKYCDGLGACLGECPNGALKIIDRVAEDFDAEAVEQYQQETEEKAPKPDHAPGCGCPSTQLESFECSAVDCPEAGQPLEQSYLSHWPVQIKLVPPNAPFLKDAHLLVLADCAAVAYPHLHRDFLSGRAVMMGCPKFDQTEEYVHKFSAIFKKVEIKKITILMMEVPCCSGLSGIVEKALAAAGKKIPLDKIILNTRGKIIA